MYLGYSVEGDLLWQWKSGVWIVSAWSRCVDIGQDRNKYVCMCVCVAVGCDGRDMPWSSDGDGFLWFIITISYLYEKSLMEIVESTVESMPFYQQ